MSDQLTPEAKAGVETQENLVIEAAPCVESCRPAWLCRALSSTWMMTALAVTEIMLGFVLLSFPYLLAASAIWVGGFALGAASLVRLIQTVSSPVERWWNLLAAVLYLSLAVMMLSAPLLSLSIWTLLIGITLLLIGAIRTVVCLTMLKHRRMAWRLIQALVTLGLGILVLYSWPASALWLIGTLIAVEMVFSGWTLLFIALASGRDAQNQES